MKSKEIEIPAGYIAGLGRDYPHPKLAHLYKGDFDDPGLPLCRNGWNRFGHTGYSIWRGNVGVDGICKVCMRRALAGKGGKRVSKKDRKAYENSHPDVIRGEN
jgi:hypothetical protein